MEFNYDLGSMPACCNVLLKLDNGDYAVGWKSLTDIYPDGVQSAYDMASVVFSGKIVGYLVIGEDKQ